MKASKRYIFKILGLLALFTVPIIAIYTEVIPFRYHLHVLFIFTLLVILATVKDNLTLKNLGVYKDRPLKHYLPYLLFTAIGIAFICAIAELIGSESLDWDSQYLYVFLVIPLSFCQEFIYRAYLMAKLKQLFTSTFAVILVNTLLFTFLHILFSPLAVVLPLAFISGLAFAWMYNKYPNLLLISLSHSILNFTAVLIYGFFK